jgi:hypothetical protein
MRRLVGVTVVAVAAAVLGSTQAAQPQGKDAPKGGPLELQLISKKDAYAWDAGGLTPKELQQQLEKIQEDMKNKKFNLKPPPAPNVDLVLKIVNTSKDEITVYYGGDPNMWTFELKGPGVVTLTNPIALTTEFRMPKGRTLKAGEAIEIPVNKLLDGIRGVGRLVYWTEPGEYTLSASYQLSDAKGKRTDVLKSEPVKIKVEMPK